MAKRLTLQVGQAVHAVDIAGRPDGQLDIVLDGIPHLVYLEPLTGGLYELIIDHRPTEVLIERDGPALRVIVGPQTYTVTAQRPGAHAPLPAAVAEGGAVIRSPMTGTVVELLVADGDSVARGAPLLVIQAMKMNNEIRAPQAGLVAGLRVRAGDTVLAQAELLTIQLPPP